MRHLIEPTEIQHKGELAFTSPLAALVEGGERGKARPRDGVPTDPLNARHRHDATLTCTLRTSLAAPEHARHSPDTNPWEPGSEGKLKVSLGRPRPRSPSPVIELHAQAADTLYHAAAGLGSNSVDPTLWRLGFQERKRAMRRS